MYRRTDDGRGTAIVVLLLAFGLIAFMVISLLAEQGITLSNPLLRIVLALLGQ